ncbi:co-chaperone GroES [Peptoniphilaceae bacterium SGI.131]
MKLRPLGKRLVLKTLKAETKTSSGIIMATGSAEKPEYAEIVEISSELKDNKDYAVGEKVIYSRYAGTSVKDKDDEYIVIEDKDVIAVVEE